MADFSVDFQSQDEAQGRGHAQEAAALPWSVGLAEGVSASHIDLNLYRKGPLTRQAKLSGSPIACCYLAPWQPI